MKPGRRQRRGFERATSIPLADLGVSGRKVRELALARAWTSAAGPTLAAQAAVEVRRGVLEVAAVDAVWARTFGPLLARLAARVAAACPDLQISRYRLTAHGTAGGSAAELLPADGPGAGEAAVRAPGRRAATGGAVPGAVSEDRLRRLAERYDERRKP